jgi:LysR family transcriptional regulator, transcription activator of glutamate synthase operon
MKTDASNDSVSSDSCSTVMSMDIDSLRWFQQVADGVTMAELTQTEFITQSGISRALTRLENEVGTPLLRKNGRNLRMTVAGSAFKRHVDALLNQLDDGLSAVNQLVDPETGTVAFASLLSLGTWLVPNLLSTFRADHPEVHFDIRQVREESAGTDLQTGRLDLEITTIRPTDRTVQWHPLLMEPLWLAVPHDHHLATRKLIHLKEVAADSFIMLRSPSLLRRQSKDLCRQAGFDPAVGFEGEDIPTLRGFVAAGLGVAIVPALHEGSPEALTGAVRHLRIADLGAAREIGLGWSIERRILPSAELFRTHVISRAEGGTLPVLAVPG